MMSTAGCLTCRRLLQNVAPWTHSPQHSSVPARTCSFCPIGRIEMILSTAEMRQLTGYIRSSAQIRWLRRNGWRFTVNAMREPVVAVAEFERKLVSSTCSVRTEEPHFEALNG